MANRFNLLTALATTCLATAFPPPAVAYVRVPPQTLGSMCRMSTHIYVLSIEKFSAEKGVILFKPVEQLKGPGGLPDSVLAKHLIGTNIKGSKVILDWAAEGKTAVLFAIMDYQGTKLDDGGGIGHACIDGFWYWVGYKPNDKVWVAINSEPSSLSLYCGKADKLGGTVTKILHGEEVGVPAIVGDKRQLEEGRGIVQQVRAGLHLDPSSTFMGNVKAVSGDGKSFTLQPVPVGHEEAAGPH